MATEIQALYGPITIGILIVLLYGVMITQTYLYMATFKSDKLWIKLFVAILFFANTIKTAFDFAFMYTRFIHQFGNFEAMRLADWIFNTDPAMTAIIAAMVQLFFAWRVKLLTSSIPLTILVAFCSVVQMIAGLATAVACSIVKPFAEFQKFQVVVILWLAFSGITDLVIAGSMVITLRRNRTGFASTDDIIDRLIRATVQTGVITAVVAILDLITFLTSNSGLHLVFNYPLAHLYTNSLMSSLNARALGNSGSSGRFNNVSSADQGIGMVRQRRDVVDVDVKSRNPPSRIVMNTAGSEADMDDVGQTTKVYMNVEEVRVTS